MKTYCLRDARGVILGSFAELGTAHIWAHHFAKNSAAKVPVELLDVDSPDVRHVWADRCEIGNCRTLVGGNMVGQQIDELPALPRRTAPSGDRHRVDLHHSLLIWDTPLSTPGIAALLVAAAIGSARVAARTENSGGFCVYSTASADECKIVYEDLWKRVGREPTWRVTHIERTEVVRGVAEGGVAERPPPVPSLAMPRVPGRRWPSGGRQGGLFTDRTRPPGGLLALLVVNARDRRATILAARSVAGVRGWAVDERDPSLAVFEIGAATADARARVSSSILGLPGVTGLTEVRSAVADGVGLVHR